jgi:hypothetical protein
MGNPDGTDEALGERLREHYIDQDSQQPRELDVAAWLDVGSALRISFPIECKSSPGKPWILFTAERRFADVARVSQQLTDRFGQELLESIAGDMTVQESPLFELPRRSVRTYSSLHGEQGCRVLGLHVLRQGSSP